MELTLSPIRCLPCLLPLLFAAALAGCEDDSSACGDRCASVDGGVGIPDGQAPSPGPDASSGSDGGGLDGGDAGLADDIVDPSLEHAVLADDLEAAASAPIADADGAQPGAKSYEDVTDDVSASTVTPLVEDEPARAVNLVIRWGTLPPSPPPVVGAWADFGGFVAVSEGSIDLVRALRWASPQDPAAPRPSPEFVAPQTDGRFVRFRSFIGAGSAGLAIRVHRSTIRPTVLALRVNGQTRSIPLDDFLSQSVVSGGWAVAIGNVRIDSSVAQEAAPCYVETGTLEGTWSYSSGTTFASFTGKAVRPDGGEDDVQLSFGDQRGAYGNYTGTLGNAGATVAGYYARKFIFDYEREGRFVARVNAAGGEVQELIVGAYDDASVAARLFRRAACAEPGASHKNYFKF